MSFTVAILPLVLVGFIAVWVIQTLQRAHSQSTTGDRNPNVPQDMLDSFIPIGMVFGSSFGVIMGFLSSTSLLFTVTLGTGIGFLVGYMAYGVCRVKNSGE